ncbi:MAG: protein translocase subunit SecF [Oscillospiraceae bacterium]|jgi:preprotein translocase subunit SecF|nr:protein translocase subunit SecF [Oscillospiraceae bacterium]
MKRLDFDFIGNRKIFFAISIGIVFLGLLFNILLGVRLDISFKGGTLLKYSYQGALDREEVEDFIKNKTGMDVSVQLSETAAENEEVLNISMPEAISLDDQKLLDNELSKKYKDFNIEQLNVNSLSPTMGKLFFLKCLVAIALSSVFLVIYVAIRFRKIGGISAGAMALVALLHDILVAYFAFVIFRIPLNDNFVAVVLSILGFSLNDTIVIYDRIRENRRKMDKTNSIGEIVNVSINQSFTRSFNTSLCTFLAVSTVAVLALIYNLESITSFAVPMMIGVISGCYSSVCICGPLWVMWKEYRQRKDELQKSKSKQKA